MGKNPEDEEGEGIDGGEDCRQSVRREVVRWLERRCPRWVANERGNVDFEECEVMKVKAPEPSSCRAIRRQFIPISSKRCPIDML